MGNIEDSEYANWSDRDLLVEIDRLAKQLQVAKDGLGKLAGFITPNTLVWYEASPGKRFAAVVDEPPRELGGGQWCARLRDLDEAYQKQTKGRTTVAAAGTWCLSPREVGVKADNWVASPNADGSITHHKTTEPADHPFPGLGTQIQTRDDRPGEIKVASAGQPDQCPVCEWTNKGLLNYGKAGEPRWMCHGCAALVVQTAHQHRTTIAELTKRDEEWRDQVSRQKKQLDDADHEIGELRQQIEDKTCARHAGQEHGKEAEELRKGIENILNTSDSAIGAVDRISLLRLLDSVDARDSLAYLEAKDAGHIRQVAEDSKKRDRELRKPDAPDFKDAATLSLVELAHRLFEQLPSGLTWTDQHEWRIAMNTWRSRYHALLGAQPAPPEIKHRFALARSRAGLSIGQAARVLGLERRVIEAMEEAAYRQDDLPIVKQMAEKYQVNIPWLLGETPLRDYTAMAGARGYEHVSDHDRDVIAEFAASLPRGAISKKAQDLRDKIRGAKMPSPDEANAELKKLLGEDE